MSTKYYSMFLYSSRRYEILLASSFHSEIFLLVAKSTVPSKWKIITSNKNVLLAEANPCSMKTLHVIIIVHLLLHIYTAKGDRSHTPVSCFQAVHTLYIKGPMHALCKLQYHHLRQHNGWAQQEGNDGHQDACHRGGAPRR